MIKIENVVTPSPEQWRAIIMGTRNPYDSWDRSDSTYESGECIIGANDHDLMKRLAANGAVHAKYRRMITVYADITAPLYFYKEVDVYKVGTVSNSCSTMHRITAKEFTLDDFSHEHLLVPAIRTLKSTIEALNEYRDIYLNGGMIDNEDGTARVFEAKDKDIWWQLIQLLPSSYNQKRTYMLNYEVLTNMYQYRRNHRLDEWRLFCTWIETLPESWIITGKEAENE